MVDLPKLLKDNVALDDETMAVVVLDDRGNPMKDENGLPVKVEDYIQKFVSTRPYLLVDVMPKKHGAINSSTGHAPTSQNPMSLEEEKAFAEKDPEGYKAWVADQWSPAKMIAAAKAKYGPNRPIPHA